MSAHTVLHTGDTHGGVAERIAGELDAPVVGSVDELRSGPVYYVAAPMEIDERTVVRLQRRLDEGGPDDGAFSIITGRTPDAAEGLFSRTPPRRSDHLLWLREEDRNWFSYDDETRVLTGNDVTPDTAGDPDAAVASLSMLVHGRSMHFYLSGGYLCGFPSDPENADFEGKQPYCVENGRMNCPLEGEILHADRLEIPHVFIDSCASMLPGNDFEGLPVHVGMGLLENSTSLIGGYRQVDAIPQLSLLHYCLLVAGYDTAARTYLLNRAARSYKTAAFPYIPFGRHDVAYHSPTRNEWSADVERGRTETVVDLTDVRAHVVDLEIPFESLPEGDGEWIVRNRTDDLANAPIYYVAFEEEGHVRLLVYTWGHLEVPSLRLSVHPEQHRTDDVAIARNALENAERAKSFGIMDNKGVGQLKDLRNRSRGFGEALDGCRHSTNGYRELDSKLDTLFDGIEQLERYLCDKLEAQYSSFLTDAYREEKARRDVRVSDEDCPYCDRPLFEKTWRDSPGDSERRRGICPLCGIVYDAPAAAPRDAYPRLEGEFVGVDPESTHRVGLSFGNPHGEPVRATFLPRLGTDYDEYRGSDAFDAGPVTRRLGPGESHTEEFTFAAGSVEPNEYWLCGYVICNLNVYQGLTKLVVGDEYGHLRSDRRADRPN